MSDDDPKASNIMMNIYVGTEATKCDGSIYGFSNFVHILTSKPKKSDGTMNFLDIVKSEFVVDTSVDYTF
jgi:hypothetical protein